MRTRSQLILVAGLLSAAAASRAQGAATTADVRCVAVALSGSALQPQSGAGTNVLMYYLGRLDGRTPKLDLEGLLTTETARMSMTDYASEATRCGQELMAKGQQLTQMGKNMTDGGQNMLSKPAK